MSKLDTGATRITDVERNLLVASTDIAGLTHATVQEQSRKTLRDSMREHDEAAA
jgi:hypothetical protein